MTAMKYALVSDSPHSRLGMMVSKTKPVMRKHLRLWQCLRRSDLLIVFPAFVTAGCFLTISQSMWEKEELLLALWGSACV